MEHLESYFEKHDGSLWFYIDNTTYQMGQGNDEYVKVTNNIEKVLDDHPNLRKVLEDDEAIELSKSDAKALQKIQKLYDTQREYDMKNAFFLGGNNLYYYFQKLNLLDDEKR